MKRAPERQLTTPLARCGAIGLSHNQQQLPSAPYFLKAE
jgi:hypothetical protein